MGAYVSKTQKKFGRRKVVPNNSFKPMSLRDAA
jgi:hypothetical protein